MKKRTFLLSTVLGAVLLLGSGCSLYETSSYKLFYGEMYLHHVHEKAWGKFTIPSEYNSKPVVGIEYGAFQSSKVQTIVFSENIQYVTGKTFIDAVAVKGVEVAKNNPYFTVIDGSLYTKDGKTLVRYFEKNGVTTFQIPDGVTTIGESAFRNVTSLTAVTLSSSVQTIEEAAFLDCSALQSIDLGQVVTIGEYAFSHCNEIKSLTVPKSVTTIGRWAFQATSIQEVTFEDAEGWWYYGNSANPKTELYASILSDKQTAAEYLTKTFFNQKWQK